MELTKRIIYYVIAQCIFVTIIVLIFLQQGFSFGLISFCLAAESMVTVLAVRKILKPLHELEETLARCIREDSCEEQLLDASDDILYMKQIKLLLDKGARERTRKNSAEVFHKQAELTALQSQINPHFLYNTLESIRGQALMDDNIEIAKMMEALSAFFRYSISRKGSLVTLREELNNIKNYMMIQSYRFYNRFSMEIFMDEEDEVAYDFKIPKLIIQPVIENAIFHGLEEKLEGGKVTIEVIVMELKLMITVSDNGKGMEGKTLEQLNKKIHLGNSGEETEAGGYSGTGIGLSNIHQRIQLLFGEEYGINVYSTPNQGTDVEIIVPIS